MSEIKARQVGRPTLYEETLCDKLMGHMAEGLSFESFAGTIGVSRDSLYEWAKVHPEFSDAKKVGTELGRLFWEKLGRDHILSESESYGNNQGGKSKSLNSAVYIFNMKNRFGWRDKQPDEEAPQAIVNNNQIQVTDEQLAKLIQVARGGAGK